MPPQLSRIQNALPLIVVAIAAASASAADGMLGTPAAADPAAVEFLLASSVKDFRSTGGNIPTAIRSARLGFITEAGRGNYLLCGAFRSGAGPQAKWINFATIKTSDYEQWLGSTAKAHCQQRAIKWYPGDHSAALMKRLKD